MKFSLIPALGIALSPLFAASAAQAQIASTVPATTVAASYIHSVSVHADGTLWAWGANLDGQLGDGSTIGHAQPAPVLLPGSPNPADPANARWTQVAAGTSHTLALNTSGELYAWGDNAAGQLGTNDRANHLRPTKVATPVDEPNLRWAQVVAGTSHTLAISTDGRLFAWGDNSTGQLGINDPANAGRPTAVYLPTGIVGHCAQVAAGNAHSLALTTDGQLFAWGNNDFGQLGDGSGTIQRRPTAVRHLAGRPAQPWTQIAAGRDHSLALGAGGQLFAWGSNRFGQLGQSALTQYGRPLAVPVYGATKALTWQQIGGGVAHSVALGSDGRAYTWGSNYAGQLGTGRTRQHRSPVAIALPAGCASRWTQVAAGGFHTLAQSAYGDLCTWGNNDFGQLGDGGTAPQATPACHSLPGELLGSAAPVK